jgi:hypothetical protein
MLNTVHQAKARAAKALKTRQIPSQTEIRKQAKDVRRNWHLDVSSSSSSSDEEPISISPPPCSATGIPELSCRTCVTVDVDNEVFRMVAVQALDLLFGSVTLVTFRYKKKLHEYIYTNLCVAQAVSWHL